MPIALFRGRTPNLLLWRPYRWGTSDTLHPCFLGRTEPLKIPANPFYVWIIQYGPRKVTAIRSLMPKLEALKADVLRLVGR